MKNKAIIQFAIASILIFFGGCQSAPKKSEVPSDLFQSEPFEIQKITSKGIESIQIIPNKSEWPSVQAGEVKELKKQSANLRLAVIGDTGCRLKEYKGKGTYQNCNITKEWPYLEVVHSLMKENYDFGIHTGDYHYREQCSDPKICPSYAKYVGYTWGAWWDDFYGPSQNLFKKSAWLFVRGNHEDCNRAYKGWAPISVHSKSFEQACEAIEPYQWTEFDDLVLINFDNSAMDDRAPFSEADAQMWSQTFNELKNKIKLLNGKKEIWFLSHKPIVGYVPNEVDAEPKAISPYIEQLMKKSGLFDQIDLFLAGHIHTQQVVPIENKVQIVVAHSGTSLDPFGRVILNQKIMTTTESKYSFGYAIFEKQGFKKWKFDFKDAKGQSQLVCLLKKNKINCE